MLIKNLSRFFSNKKIIPPFLMLICEGYGLKNLAGAGRN